MTETTATSPQIKARRGDLVLVEMRDAYTTSSYKRVEQPLAYRLMKVTNLFRDGRIKMVSDDRYGEDGYPQKYDELLYATGRHWLLPAADWDTAKARQLAAGHVYPDSTSPRDFPSLDTARETLAPARRGYVAPEPEIPQPTPSIGHVNCGHGQSDSTGYVVAYSHVNGNEVTFTDIEHVQGSTNYSRALELVYEARRKVRSGDVDAVYAVIHHVYDGGHRPV